MRGAELSPSFCPHHFSNSRAFAEASRSTLLLRVSRLISSRTVCPLLRLRQVRITVAPFLASSLAAAFPMPELAPVKRKVFSMSINIFTYFAYCVVRRVRYIQDYIRIDSL